MSEGHWLQSAQLSMSGAKQIHMALYVLVIEFGLQSSTQLQPLHCSLLYIITCNIQDIQMNDGVVYGHWRCFSSFLHRLSVHATSHLLHH